MKKYFYTLTLCLLSFTACANNTSKPLTVILDWFVNPQHAPIIIAQEKGFFKEHGITVNIIQPADPADPPKLVAAQQADIAIDYQPELYLQIANGLPLIRIGTLIDSPLRVMASLQTSDIKSLSDLKGKKIGVSLSGVGDAILDTMLRYNHVDQKQVEIINVHYDLVQALLTKQISAVSGVQRNFEIPELALAKQPARVFYPEKNGVPMFDELIFVANKNHLHDPRLLAFMQAIDEATHYIKQHPQTSWNILIKAYPSIAKPDSMKTLNHAAWNITLPYFANAPLAVNQTRYEAFAHWLQHEKLITIVLPVTDYAVDLRQSPKN